MKSKFILPFITFLALFVFFLFIYYFERPSEVAHGSTMIGNEYIATSTAPNSVFGATISTSNNIKAFAGTLGSVIITGANTGVVNFYDATTSNVSLRTGQKATSTILIASIPASAVAGTYTIDAAFGFGLYIDLPSGTMPTTTITYR